jgi:hypothetical protein
VIEHIVENLSSQASASDLSISVPLLYHVIGIQQQPVDDLEDFIFEMTLSGWNDERTAEARALPTCFR